MNRTPLNQKAFTILELLIATTVFSVILLLVTTGILNIGKAYYKGATQSRTQEAARSIIDEVSRGIQFSGEAVQPTVPFGGGPIYASAVPGSKYGFCVNGIGYTYIIDKQLAVAPSGSDQTGKALISYPVGTCAGFTVANVSTASGRELLGQGMRLTDLEVTDNLDNTFTIKVGVATGEGTASAGLNLFNVDGRGISDTCKGSAGQQFCAVSKLTTTVLKRVK